MARRLMTPAAHGTRGARHATGTEGHAGENSAARHAADCNRRATRDWDTGARGETARRDDTRRTGTDDARKTNSPRLAGRAEEAPLVRRPARERPRRRQRHRHQTAEVDELRGARDALPRVLRAPRSVRRRSFVPIADQTAPRGRGPGAGGGEGEEWRTNEARESARGGRRATPARGGARANERAFFLLSPSAGNMIAR